MECNISLLRRVVTSETICALLLTLFVATVVHVNVELLSNAETRRLLFDCHKIPIVVHRPYNCALKARNPQTTLESWLKKNHHRYDIIGIYGHNRHCSRYSTGELHQYNELIESFDPKSASWQLINNVLNPTYTFGQLSRKGIQEAVERGRRFKKNFGVEFLSRISIPKDLRLKCSYVNRTCDTLKYFISSVFSESHATLKELPFEAVEHFHYKHDDFQATESMIELQKQITTQANSILANSNQLIAGKHLDFKQITLFVNILSIEDANNGTAKILDTFGESLSSELNHYREFARFHKNSLPNPAANVSTKALVQSMIDDLLWISKDADNGNAKLTLNFSHDTTIIALLDYLGFFEGKKDLSFRNVPMCANFEILVLRDLNQSNLRVLTLLNDEIIENKIHSFKSNNTVGHTYDFDSFIDFLKSVVV